MEIRPLTSSNSETITLSSQRIVQASDNADKKSSVSSCKDADKNQTCWDSFIGCLKQAWNWVIDVLTCKCFCKVEDKEEDKKEISFNPIQLFLDDKDKAREAIKADPKAFFKNFVNCFLNTPEEFKTSYNNIAPMISRPVGVLLSNIKFKEVDDENGNLSLMLVILVHAISLINEGKLNTDVPDQAGQSVTPADFTKLYKKEEYLQIINDLNTELARNAEKVKAAQEVILTR